MASPNPDLNLYSGHYGSPSPFPPSFEGNPYAYAFGLFGDVVAAALASAILLTFVFEQRRLRQIDVLLNNYVTQPAGIIPWTPLWLYRMGMMCFLSFVVMRCLPDALWMLAWGEVSRSTIEAMLKFDLIADGLSIIPLFAATVCWAWGRQVIPQKLTEGKMAVVGGHPPWLAILKNARIVGVVFVISLLVTIGKASG
jgi:hypothetical protein